MCNEISRFTSAATSAYLLAASICILVHVQAFLAGLESRIECTTTSHHMIVHLPLTELFWFGITEVNLSVTDRCYFLCFHFARVRQSSNWEIK